MGTDVISGASGITPAFLDEVVSRLAEGRRVRRHLPGGGRLHVDRRLPFLCVVRKREGPDSLEPIERLAATQASYLVAPRDERWREPVGELVRRIAAEMLAELGGFLVVELWAAEEEAGEEDQSHRPSFRVVPGTLPEDDGTIEELRRALADVPLRPPPLDVAVSAGAVAAPPGERTLQLPEPGPNGRCHLAGIEVQPVYRQAETGTPYPVVLETLRRGLGTALVRTFFHFALNHTREAPEHYHALGRRMAVKETWRIDGELAEIGESFDFLLQVTPSNPIEAWEAFEGARFEREPAFDYRPLVVDADALKRRIYLLPLERLEDPTLFHLLNESRHEIDRRVTMLDDRGTPRFLYGSLARYGPVEPELLELARRLLAELPARDPGEEGGDRHGARAIAERAQAELEVYRRVVPEIADPQVRRDISGLLVSRGQLLIGSGTSLSTRRLEALMQHEVGTHVLTFHNGRAQPLGLFHAGLAGYEELQEGLGVFAEYLTGGLSTSRLRTLAARVLAVQQLLEGASFVDTFRELTGEHGFDPAAAFTLAMRVHRSGGLTKDAIYLRGLTSLLAHLAAGGELEPLYTGKIALRHLPVVRELEWRGILEPAPLRPRFLSEPACQERLDRARAGLSVLDLARESLAP